ncbi:MAG: hypothetical protein H7210_00400 [Pyrinomonadaceae bacterium]|nr:hypothetical protein [Phycisphaerales bacterium]
MFASKRPDMPTMSKQQERARRVSLIGMYILGLAVGCVLVGMLLKAKRAMLAPQHPVAPQSTTSPTSAGPAGSNTATP